MASAPSYTKLGAKAATPAKLNKEVFEILPENHTLLKQAYVTYMANGRVNLAESKTRGEVRGGGRKPWKQKGTGRARFGSSRNPIWRGGGITFGPTGEENYSKGINIKAKRLAIRQALSLKAKDGKIIVIEDASLKDGKTAELTKLLNKIGADRRVLIATEHKDAKLDQASRNLPNVKAVRASYLNVFDVTNADKIVITNAALAEVTKWLGGAK